MARANGSGATTASDDRRDCGIGRGDGCSGREMWDALTVLYAPLLFAPVVKPRSRIEDLCLS
jgi:hypothetical protein